MVAAHDSLPPCPAAALARPQKNHLSGLQRKLLKLTFWNQDQLMQARPAAVLTWPAW